LTAGDKAAKPESAAGARLEQVAALANLAALIVAPLVAVLTWPHHGRLTPLLIRDVDTTTRQRLDALEEDLRRQPGDVRLATEVGRLWQALGQPPWSYTALRAAERHGPSDAGSCLALAAAYLDLGELDDSRRALAAAERACGRRCPEPLDVKISLLVKFTDTLVREGIDPRQELAFTERAFRKLVREMAWTPPAPAVPKPR